MKNLTVVVSFSRFLNLSELAAKLHSGFEFYIGTYIVCDIVGYTVLKQITIVGNFFCKTL